jgi:hypothetical protein
MSSTIRSATWLTGLVLGHDFTSKCEMDAEFYSQGFHPSN